MPTESMANIDDAKSGIADLIPEIERALAAACQFGPHCPQRLGEAIRYALLAPGKRLRPALVLMSAEACGGSWQAAMPGAVAVEMIHAYSLIHDDLPAMDDDDLRRGRATVHIAFDEATAILAGDALQPQAFRHLSEHVADPQRAVEAVRILATAAGAENLVGGQADDLAADSASRTGISGAQGAPAGPDSGGQATPPRTIEHLESIHRRKTGALFAAALDLGAVLVGADNASRRALANYARDLGLAFQVVDDLLDHLSDAETLGKRAGKDADRGKLTYPGLLGLEAAQQKARQLVRSSREHVQCFGDAAWRLEWLAGYVLQRTC
jgi:geranylgeranyl diphosphate synthase type II